MFGGPGRRAPVRRLSRVQQRAVTVRIMPHHLRAFSVERNAIWRCPHRLPMCKAMVFPVLAGPNDVGLSRKHIVEGLKASLMRLDMVSCSLVCDHEMRSSTQPHAGIAHAGNFSLQQTPMTERRCAQEYVDVLYCHTYDTKTPIEETVRRRCGLPSAHRLGKYLRSHI